MPKQYKETTEGNAIGEAGMIRKYFGMQEGQTLTEFGAELKELKPADKTELADGAAKEMGYQVVE